MPSILLILPRMQSTISYNSPTKPIFSPSTASTSIKSPMTIRFPNFVTTRRKQQVRSSAMQQRLSNSSQQHQRSSIPITATFNQQDISQQTTSPPPSPNTTSLPPNTNTPPASLAARQGLIHLRMRAPSKDVCVICAQTFCVNDVVTTLPCGHMHHSKCILCWLQRKCTCPSCRYELPSVEDGDEEYGKEFFNSSPQQRKPPTVSLFNPLLGDPNGVLGDDNCRSGFFVYLADASSLAQTQD
jgi:hypothetical protein